MAEWRLSKLFSFLDFTLSLSMSHDTEACGEDLSLVQQLSQISIYQDWLNQQSGRAFDTYEDLHQWSVTDLEGFWQSIWDFREVQSPVPVSEVLPVDEMPGAQWFTGTQVNLASQVFAHVDAAEKAGQPAIVCEDELGEVVELSWSELKRKSASLALNLKAMGVQKGDRVAAYLPNCPETVIAFLACTSIGAVWSLCAPDMGVKAVADRFAQIRPKVLIAADGVHYAGKPMDRSATVEQLLSELPTVQGRIVLRTPFASSQLDANLTFEDAVSRIGKDVSEFQPEPLPFDHPVWILYSSGTTGLPKPIVLGQGGAILSGYVNLLHLDLGPSYEANSFGERFFWFTSTGWVMWNILIGVMLHGAAVMFYDGSPFHPTNDALQGQFWPLQGEVMTRL